MTLAQKTNENEILRNVLDDYKLANELLELALYWQGKYIRAVEEELTCYKRIVSG